MSGLQRQVLPVLLKGLDQLAPKQTGIMSGLDALLNMYAQQGDQQGYEFVPRPGTTIVNRPGGSGGVVGTALGMLGSHLHMMTDTALWNRAANAWGQVAGYASSTMRASQATTPMISRANAGDAAGSCDVAYVGGYRVEAVAGGSSGTAELLIRVLDSTGAAVGPAFMPGLGNASYQTRIAVSGTAAVIFWADGGNSRLRAVKFDSTTATFGAAVNVAIPNFSFTPMFDVQTVPSGKIAVVFNNTGASTFSFCLLDPATMTTGGSVTPGATGGDAVTKGFLANSFSTNTLFLAWVSTSTGLHVDQFDATTLAAGTATVYDAAATVGASITGYRTGASTATVFFTLKGTLPFDDAIKTSTGSTVSTLMTGRAIASRAVDLSSGITAPLFLTKYRGVGQATYFLVTPAPNSLVTPFDIARSMPDVAAADPGNALIGLVSLPNLVTAGSSSVYITAGLQSVSLQSGTGGISSLTGAACIKTTLLDPALGSPVELNGSLHFPGAMPLVYDGGSTIGTAFTGEGLVEEGFPIFPEQSDAYVLGVGGAMTPSSTYTYLYVLEASDANGNLVQSGPNLIAQQAVLGPANNSVQHSIPVVINTRRVFVRMGVYRTPANGNGSVYYRVASLGFFRGPTSPTRLSFTDTISDTALVTGAPLYTDGGVLENLAPPPCTTMAIHRGRLLAGGVDGDPSAVWFSKQVTSGFGVSFNDGLVSHVGVSSERLTALGSMDSYVAAFTSTTSWSSSNDYPDDTGAGGVLQFSQVSATNGCAGARLIARADDGLMCWQGKTAVAGGAGPGPWRLTRGLAWEWIGRGIQLDAAAMAPQAIIAVPGQNQLRVIGTLGGVGGTVLVRETTFETWATWTYLVGQFGAPTFVDAIVWNGAVVYLCSDASAIVESASIYSDNATAIAHSLTLSPFNFAGVAGYQRIYVGQLTGRLLGDLSLGESLVLNVTQTIDGAAMAPKVRTLTPDANGLFNGVEFDPGPNGKCSAYQLTISNAAGGANDARCAWTLAAVTMEVGIKPNVNRLSPANRAI